MNQEVNAKAQELAALIARSPEYITMRATEDAASQDQELNRLMDQYNALRSQVEELTMKKEPDFDAIADVGRQLEEVQAQVKQQPMYQALQSARRAFSQMMADVNAQLSSVLNPGGAQGGCSGNCSGCSGCQ